VLVVVIAAAAINAPAAAQRPPSPSPQSLPVEWARRGDPWARPGIEGYVHNTSRYRIGSVRLTVEALDENQRPVNNRTVWVYGNIAAGDRGYFSFPVLAADAERTYRITVESFVLISLEAP
jgi:hypothetical protein